MCLFSVLSKLKGEIYPLLIDVSIVLQCISDGSDSTGKSVKHKSSPSIAVVLPVSRMGQVQTMVVHVQVKIRLR
jgi:hypothetical protein